MKKDDCYTIPKALKFTNQTTVGTVKKQEERKRRADNCLTDIEKDEEKEKRNKKREEEIYIRKRRFPLWQNYFLFEQSGWSLLLNLLGSL